MVDICSSAISPTGCDHFTVTVNVDGFPVTVQTEQTEAMIPLTAEERQQFVMLSIRRLRQKGVSLAQFLNRVTHGEEATNVKQYDIIAAGAAITKTNIGTAYVDVLPGANGQRSLVDFTGCTQFRIILNANLIGTGQWGARVVRDGDNAVLFDAPNLGAAGERELDSATGAPGGQDGFRGLPVGFTGLTVVRVQGKSQTAADDPIYRRCILLVR